MIQKIITPIDSIERIHSLDLLRGAALLGILLMNITSFSQVGTAYINPTISAGLEGYNKYFWNFNWLFSDTRFMSMFSMLFGAGIILFSERIALKGMTAAKWHYRRMLWLFIFGLLHAYLIWMGDILVSYAICGALIFLFRNAKLKTLVTLGIIFFFMPLLISTLSHLGLAESQLIEAYSYYYISPEEFNQYVAAYRGTYFEQLPYRIEGALMLQVFLFLLETFWRASSMMFLGMILYKTGFLAGRLAIRTYTYVCIGGISIGLIISYLGLNGAYQNEWSGYWVGHIASKYNYVASAFMAIAYFAGLIWIQKKGYLKILRTQLQYVGRMAFTNYIASSIICTLIFYGHGLGLFETFDRFQQFLTVLFVWSILVVASSIILSKYKQGPLEWLWRKLTYL